MAELPGANCTHGGHRVDVGLDDNLDGSLGAAEIDASEYICNGAPGVQGEQGETGPPGTTTWSGIVDRPADLVDGDDDSLATITGCADGQVATFRNSTGWTCEDDEVLSETQVEQMITNGTISLAAGTTVGGERVVAKSSCGDGQILVYSVSSSTWACGDDNDSTLSEVEVRNIIESYGALNLQPSAKLAGSPILSAATLPAPDWSNLQNIPPDLADGDNIGIDIVCEQGEILVYNDGWGCTPFSNVIDSDGDGSLTWNDCNDASTAFGDRSLDSDCDGVLNDVDCDDTDPNRSTVDGLSSECAASSCADLLSRVPSAANGTYWLNHGGGAYQGFCYMSAGGYTLVAKIGSTSDNNTGWSYGGDYWSRNSPLNESNCKNTSNGDVLCRGYYEYVANDGFLMSMGAYTNTLVVGRSGLTAKQAFINSQFNLDSMSRSQFLNWISAAGTAASEWDNQPHCNRIGFNRTDSSSVGVRFGITMNNEDDCNSNDSAIGFGTYTNNDTGGTRNIPAGGHRWSSDVKFPKQGFIFVK